MIEGFVCLRDDKKLLSKMISGAPVTVSAPLSLFLPLGLVFLSGQDDFCAMVVSTPFSRYLNSFVRTTTNDFRVWLVYGVFGLYFYFLFLFSVLTSSLDLDNPKRCVGY